MPLLLEKRAVQCPLDDDRALGGLANCTMRSGFGALAAASVKARPKPMR